MSLDKTSFAAFKVGQYKRSCGLMKLQKSAHEIIKTLNRQMLFQRFLVIKTEN